MFMGQSRDSDASIINIRFYYRNEISKYRQDLADETLIVQTLLLDKN